MKTKRVSKQKREMLKKLHDIQEQYRISIFWARSEKSHQDNLKLQAKELGKQLKEFDK
jgi:hypothetical protein